MAASTTYGILNAARIVAGPGSIAAIAEIAADCGDTAEMSHSWFEVTEVRHPPTVSHRVLTEDGDILRHG